MGLASTHLSANSASLGARLLSDRPQQLQPLRATSGNPYLGDLRRELKNREREDVDKDKDVDKDTMELEDLRRELEDVDKDKEQE